jgi:Ca-activated chloride channel family protein
VEHIEFKHIWWLLALAILAVVFILRRKKKKTVFVIPFAATWAVSPKVPRLQSAAAVAALVGMVLIILALARPQHTSRTTEYRKAPCDVVIALDASLSMLAEDYELNDQPVGRLEILKPIIEQFISARPLDRIGIVLFSGRAYTLCEPTLLHAQIAWSLRRLKIDRFPEGTAIGDGLVLALTNLARLEQPEHRRSQFVVLVSDGSNNGGIYTTPEAIAMAQAAKVPVYTIAVGNSGIVNVPYTDVNGTRQSAFSFSQIDEGLLWSIADQTRGAFFRGASIYKSQQSFDEVGQLQSPLQVRGSRLEYRELYIWFAVPGVCFTILSALFSSPAVIGVGTRSALAVKRAFHGTFIDHPRSRRFGSETTHWG